MEYEITRYLYTESDERYLVGIDVKETAYQNFKAYIKWDGCIDLIFDEDRADMQRLHVCDLDSFIERLEILKKIGEEHFEEW